MRVSPAAANHSTSAMFTVVSSGCQVGSRPAVVQTQTVALNRLSELFKRLGATGAKILSVTPAGEDLPPVAASAPAPEAKPVTQAPTPKKKAHADVPVNTYKPKNPFIGTVTDNYSLLKEGAIGRVQLTFDLSAADPSSNTWKARASASFPKEDAKGGPTRCVCTPSPAPATVTWVTTPCRSAFANWSTRTKPASRFTASAPPISAIWSPAPR